MLGGGCKNPDVILIVIQQRKRKLIYARAVEQRFQPFFLHCRSPRFRDTVLWEILANLLSGYYHS